MTGLPFTTTRRSLLLLSLVAALAAGCDSEEAGPSSQPATATAAPTETVPTGTVPAGGEIALPAGTARFAGYEAVPALGADAPAYAGPATPQSLDGVQVAPELRAALARPGVSEALLAHGFVVVPADLRLFHFAYEGNVYSGWPVFVTTDAAYHTWHEIFDKLLRDLEQKALLPRLETLTTGLLQAAQAQTAELAGTPLAEPASRVEQLFALAAAELGLRVSLGPLAQEEKALVDAHSAADETSPLVGSPVDYSLFTPRGHYTRNAELTRYFVAMSVLGQLGFCLPGTTGCPGLEPAREAILAARVLDANRDLVALWQEIYEPTAFLVGLADDYTPLELADAVRAAAPAALADPGAFADDATVQQVVDALTRARAVLISPDRAAIRFLGTRFVVDAYVLDQLLYPYVGSSEKPRTLPSALDLAAAFGSDFAYQALAQAGATGYEHYDEQLAALRAGIARRPAEAWGATVYDAWLYALAPEFATHGQAYPDFMRSEAWAAKAQQSGLGSYAELKHDTILYAKQAVAEGGDVVEAPRRNWVEPEPVVFARLAAAADLTLRGLGERGLLTRGQARLLRDASGMFGFFERIARDELAGAPISEPDNDRLSYLGGELESIFWRTADRSPSGDVLADEDAAVVADVASGPTAVLQVATGRIDRIYVLVPDDDGVFQVAAGGVYSYYEFASPVGERLTDEAWRARLDGGQAPARPVWEEGFLPR